MLVFLMKEKKDKQIMLCGNLEYSMIVNNVIGQQAKSMYAAFLYGMRM